MLLGRKTTNKHLNKWSWLLGILYIQKGPCQKTHPCREYNECLCLLLQYRNYLECSRSNIYPLLPTHTLTPTHSLPHTLSHTLTPTHSHPHHTMASNKFLLAGIGRTLFALLHSRQAGLFQATIPCTHHGGHGGKVLLNGMLCHVRKGTDLYTHDDFIVLPNCPTHSQYPDTELTSSCSVLEMPSGRLGSNKHEICKSLVYLDQDKRIFWFWNFVTLKGPGILRTEGNRTPTNALHGKLSCFFNAI